MIHLTLQNKKIPTLGYGTRNILLPLNPRAFSFWPKKRFAMPDSFRHPEARHMIHAPQTRRGQTPACAGVAVCLRSNVKKIQRTLTPAT
jgi:hypothetical protein